MWIRIRFFRVGYIADNNDWHFVSYEVGYIVGSQHKAIQMLRSGPDTP